jgi:hypothetical protein
MKKDYMIGDLVHIPQAVELLDCPSDGAQLNIPLRVQTTESPRVGIVAEAPAQGDYVIVLCDGDKWSVRTRSLYSVGDSK